MLTAIFFWQKHNLVCAVTTNRLTSSMLPRPVSAAEPFWLSEVYALRGENFRALGMAARAEESYEKALTINPGNRTAAEALSRKHSEPQPAQR